MITVPWSEAGCSGARWRRESDGSISLWCPKGHLGSLSGHKIAADGTVSPSVVCPRDFCGFHDYVRLADWFALSGRSV